MFLLAIFPVMGVKMYRVLVIVATVLHIGEIGGLHVREDDRDDRTKDNRGDDIDFSQAVLDPDTGLMCVHNQGRGNLQKVTNNFFLYWTHNSFYLEDATHGYMKMTCKACFILFDPYLKETKYVRTIKCKVIQKVLWPSKTFTLCVGTGSLETSLFAQDRILLS